VKFEETPTDLDRRVRAIPYYRFVVLGLLSLDSLLLQQFVGMNRDYLTSRSSDLDVGLTIPGFDVPTTQFVICALAVAIPCLTILGAHYTFASPYAKLSKWIESTVWMLGVTGSGVALTATFWFISPMSSPIFLASGFLLYVIYAISSGLSRMSRARVIRASGAAGSKG
jgi:cation transport ATPase